MMTGNFEALLDEARGQALIAAEIQAAAHPEAEGAVRDLALEAELRATIIRPEPSPAWPTTMEAPPRPLNVLDPNAGVDVRKLVFQTLNPQQHLPLSWPYAAWRTVRHGLYVTMACTRDNDGVWSLAFSGRLDVKHLRRLMVHR